MMVPPVGSVAEPYSFPIEWGKVREFAAATQSRYGGFVGDPDIAVPPTFLACASAWWAEASNCILDPDRDQSQVIHGEQEFVFHGEPPRVGEWLVAQQRLDDVYAKSGRRCATMTFVVVATEFRNSTGRVVAEAKQTVILFGSPQKGTN